MPNGESLFYNNTRGEHRRRYIARFLQHRLAFFLAGILLGIRLSYFPLLVPALLVRLKDSGRLKCAIAGIAGILIWFIPLLAITGWSTLITAAQTQSYGHFSDFGGTVSTHPQLWLRLIKTFESIWADGFGLYWQGRHPITAYAQQLP